jgi:hypothetical protein
MNPIYTIHPDSRLLRLCVAIGALSLAALLNGCFENYGRIKRNPELTRAFQSDQVEPGYKYYYYGRTNSPYAIVGIDPAFQLSSKVWREVDPGTEQFKQMIYWVWGGDYYSSISGASILSPSGEKVGIWYSSIWFVAIRFEENKRIAVMPDTPFIRGSH